MSREQGQSRRRHAFDPPCLSEVGRALAIKRANMTPLVGRMKARGLVSDAPIDGRSLALTLTEAGKELLQTLMPIALQAQQHMLDPLSPTERQEFIQLMKRMLEHHEGHQHMTASEPASNHPVEP